MDTAVEAALRDNIIRWVRERAEANGGFLHRDELLGHVVGGRRLPIIDYSRGIRNPARFSSTLAIVSSVHGPYDDIENEEDGLLHYAYRDGDPFGGDNAKRISLPRRPSDAPSRELLAWRWERFAASR